jgi:type IV secretory pathway VirB2 component (pilin)
LRISSVALGGRTRGVCSWRDTLDGSTAWRIATPDAGQQRPLAEGARMTASFTGQLITWSVVLIVVAAIAIGLLFAALDWWERNGW